MSTTKVAVVTGANKGLGYAIVKGLCKQFKGDVILTARDEGRGKEAVAALEKEGAHAKFFQLDITDKESCKRLRDYLHSEYGGVDVLVNNAGLAYNFSATEPNHVQALNSIACNYYGTMNVSEALMPMLRPHGRVVNVCSRAGLLKQCEDDTVRSRLKADDLTIAELNTIMDKYVELTKTDAHKSYGKTNYGFSKIGEFALTRIYHRQLMKDTREDLIINGCCPGYVKTDMTSQKGGKSPDEGADTPLYLALLPENATSPRGEFVAERNVVDWVGGDNVRTAAAGFRD